MVNGQARFRHWAAIAALGAAAVPLSAAAQALTPSTGTPPRTVSWYADNPRVRASVQLACLEDPGRLDKTADCVNSDRANVESATREARARTGTMDPRNPAFWSNDPQNRRAKLVMCRLTPHLDYCEVARRSLLIEAGQIPR
jgi:hypothetical protein